MIQYIHILQIAQLQEVQADKYPVLDANGNATFQTIAQGSGTAYYRKTMHQQWV